ncbi:type VI secretion system tip protein VgrG [Jeongeupia naejangsanensis]|uniref:Type VI secretion system tip protein VgrG n=1 Tax=Jeongeupia naejangsanensis TaxID=613195 RepID=A0ABS2BL67_9NEIS|nr:type VI secretion system tip protein VgrG [Jeongeupia naejangsanensis]MBM3116358.1 type VI secretion system tip protein VgrG [Jeongeupia naejangsanensis]
MPTRPTDTNTSLSLTATAPLDALYASGFSGHETLNALGEIAAQCVSTSALTMSDAIAKHVTLSLNNDSDKRPLDGLCAEISQLPLDGSGGFERYAVTLRPWLWWLTLASNNRIFQNKTVPDIVKAVFAVHGFSDYQLKLNASYTAREYCVQYGESDFAFVSRLLEDEGIFYFFTHATGKHTLVLADNNDAFPACPNASTLAFKPGEMGARELHTIRGGQLRQQAVSTGHRTTDYEFTTPATALYTQAQTKDGPLSRYEHPGGYTVKATGDTLAKRRIDALRTQALCFVGESDCRWLIPGHTFTLTGHDSDAANIEWLVTAVTHDGDHQHYANRFEAIPKATTYRPPRTTAKPYMHTQTAIVVGKSGEEIWTDQYGRIKVQFHWDRDGQNDENSSCWIRVMQAWTGKSFGAQFIPRIGQEVIVTFIDGDPDRPLVTGCVYNGDNTLPYALPANQTQSGIKTNSSRGGGGFNELRFEDKKDSEEVFLQAQKDFTANVLNDSKTTIGHDETLTVKNDRTRTVSEGNDSTTIEKGNRTTTIKTGTESLEVKGKRTLKVDGDQSHTTGGKFEHKISGDYTLTIDGNLTIKVGGTLTLQSTGAFTAKSDGALTSQAGTSLTNKAGTALTNQAGTALTNKAGTTLTNDAGVSLMNKAAAEQTVDGGGMLTVKGGIVKLN